MKKREFDIDFQVNQRFTYTMTVEAETPEQAIELAQDIDFDRGNAEEDGMIDSWDDTDTIRVLGERISHDNGVSSHREPFDPPITPKSTPFQKYEESSANNCPFCDSEHIVGHHFESDNLIAWRHVDCTECQRSWTEQFTMINIEEL